MVDGVNITVEAHWRLPKGGGQCDSTNVVTGISEHHSASAGVLFSVSCFQNTLQGPYSSMLILRTATVMQVISRNTNLKAPVCCGSKPPVYL